MFTQFLSTCIMKKYMSAIEENMLVDVNPLSPNDSFAFLSSFNFSSR